MNEARIYYIILFQIINYFYLFFRKTGVRFQRIYFSTKYMCGGDGNIRTIIIIIPSDYLQYFRKRKFYGCRHKSRNHNFVSRVHANHWSNQFRSSCHDTPTRFSVISKHRCRHDDKSSWINAT